MDFLCNVIIPAVFILGSIFIGVNVMACVMLGRMKSWDDDR